ncbi:MAG TPA: hypothetical protein VGM56_01755 [Byssovorax sp.]|jgi:hypothetical protein
MKKMLLVAITARVTGAVAMATLTLACGACGGSDPPAQPPPGPPPLPVATTPPVVPSAPCDAVQSSALTTAIGARVNDEAAGGKAEGKPLCGVVAEGIEVVSDPIQLEQGACYTILGEGLPPVSEVDVLLRLDLASSGLPMIPVAGLGQQPLLVDTMIGLHAGAGTKAGCYVWTLPTAPARVVVKSSKGGPGPVAAQLYKRKKH